jgi:hypothetical protein
MKPADWIPLVAAVNNGWTFAAFAVVVGMWLYFRWTDSP